MLTALRELSEHDAEVYHAKVPALFQDFVGQQLRESVMSEFELGYVFRKEILVDGLALRHKADFLHEVAGQPLIYLENKVITRPVLHV